MKANSDDIGDSQTKRDEVKLALELSDIIDELNSVNRLFEAQKDALDTAIKIFTSLHKSETGRDRYRHLPERLSAIITQDIEGYIKQVKRMTADAQRTKESVSLWATFHVLAEYLSTIVKRLTCLAQGPARSATERGISQGSALFERAS